MAASRVLIIGGGFGGCHTARALLRSDADVAVTLVSRDNYFVFQPLLPEVVGGAVHALDTVVPLRMLLPGATIRAATVRTVNLQERWVELVEGNAGRLERLDFDHLVLAVGLAADLARYPGLPEHGYTVKDAVDSFVLRNHVVGCLEQADLVDDEAHRRRLLTFVVVGGGYSGIEVLGELQELVRRALEYYPGLREIVPRFVLVEYQNAILPELPADLARYAHGVLAGRGIEFLLGHGIKSAAATALELDDGTIIETVTIVAAIGNGPTELVRSLDLELARGRIVTAPDMRVPGHEGVWAIGDCAAIPQAGARPAPPTAQAATREATTLAANITAAMAGRPTKAFAFQSSGVFASLGGRRAVADIFGIRLSGLVAWLVWLVAYAAMLPTWPSRIRVTLGRLLDVVLPRDVTRTRTGGVAASRYVRHRAGDVVMSPGQLGDGVHLVIEGAYEQVGPTGPERHFLPGDTFGREEIEAGKPHQRFVRAVEDSRCFILGRDEYLHIQGALRQAHQRLPKGKPDSLVG